MTSELTASVGIDVGTGSARALVLADDGAILASAERGYPLLTPRPGYAEQAPDDWWDATVAAIRVALADAGSPPIAGVGLSGQMHGAVLVDEALRPLRSALLWCDTRAADAVAATVREAGRDWLIERAGNPPLPGFTAPQLRWLAEHGDPAVAGARWLLCAKDFVRARLTGVAAADPTDASGTGLMDVTTGAWSGELADLYGVEPSVLPAIVESGAAAGRVTAAAAAATGLPEGTPVAAGAADNAAAALGAGVLSPGELLISVGTSGTLLSPLPGATPDPTGRCHLFRHAVPGRWYAMAVVLSAGGALSWWDRVVGAPLDELSAKAAAVAPGSDGVVALPYLSGRRMPRYEPDARAAVAGLSLAHGRGHLTRAVVEGAGFALADGLACLRELGVDAGVATVTGGASSHRLWQEVLGLALPSLRLRRTAFAGGAALGAALLGRQAAGGRLDDAVRRAVSTEPVAPPTASAADRAAVAAAYRRFRALSDDPLLSGGDE